MIYLLEISKTKKANDKRKQTQTKNERKHYENQEIVIDEKMGELQSDFCKDL